MDSAIALHKIDSVDVPIVRKILSLEHVVFAPDSGFFECYERAEGHVFTRIDDYIHAFTFTC